MRILLLTSEFPPDLHGGVGRYCLEFYEHMKRCYATDVLCIPTYKNSQSSLNEKDPFVKIKIDGVNKIIFYYSNDIREFLCHREKNVNGLQKHGLETIFAMIRTHISSDYDVVYVQDYFVSFVGAYILLNNISKKMVSCVHLPLYAGFTYFDKPIDDELHQSLEAVLIRFSNKVIVPSLFAKRVLTQIYSIDPEKISPIPLGVKSPMDCRLDKFNSGTVYSKSRKLKLLSVSRFTEQKGLTYIFDVLTELKNRCVDFNYLIIGSGPKEDAFKQLVQQHGLDDEICHIPHVEPEYIYKYYQQSDLYISTSIYETFGLSILEAMSQGCIPIAFKLSAIKELVKDNETGILVDMANRNKMIETIYDYYRQHRKYIRIKATAISHAKRFNWEKHVVSVIGEFKECLNGK